MDTFTIICLVYFFASGALNVGRVWYAKRQEVRWHQLLAAFPVGFYRFAEYLVRFVTSGAPQVRVPEYQPDLVEGTILVVVDGVPTKIQMPGIDAPKTE